MKMSLNALQVQLVLLVLVLASTVSPTSTVSATSTASPVSTTSTVSSTSTTGKSASARSATEEKWDWDECVENRQCDNVTCDGCHPDDKRCADRCRQRQKCDCGCSGFQNDGLDADLWRKCESERACWENLVQCYGSCSSSSSLDEEEYDECTAKCMLANKKCSCECLLVTRAQASVAVAITAATTCSAAEEQKRKWDRCFSKCNNAEDDFTSECSGSENVETCVFMRVKNCACGCAGFPSTTFNYHPDTQNSCRGCYNSEVFCKQDLMSTEIERKNWCWVYGHKCECACLAGVAINTNAAAYRTATKDREQLELCAYVRSCHTATCGCLEGDAECVSQCRDSCRCGCLRFPADGPGDRPAAGGLTVGQCRDQMDACATSCAPGNTGCRNSCFLEREVCNCRCAGRSSGPPERSPTDSEDSKINMYCNYLS